MGEGKWTTEKAPNATDTWWIVSPDEHVIGRVHSSADAHAIVRAMNAVDGLEKALEDAALNLDACAIAIKRGGKSEGRHILAEGWADRARTALASLNHPAGEG